MRIAVASSAIVFAMIAGACAPSEQNVTVASASPSPPPTASTGAASTAVMGSCVQRYSLAALEERDYAFDGVVTRIDKGAEPDPDRVAFDVREWFKGGSGAASTKRATGFTATTSAGGSPHSVGQRLLVAGDDDFVWECGFTQAYDADVARQWREALHR